MEQSAALRAAVPPEYCYHVGFLTGLHGIVALVLFCSLLFVEEAGVPLLFVPGEVVLIAAGILIADGALDPWIFLPLAFLATLGGALTGYAWSRTLGTSGLRSLAERFGFQSAIQRIELRVSAAGPREIALSRLLPGLRIYTTLVSGAMGVDRRVFMIGAAPAIAGWVVVFTLLGALVGEPVARLWGTLGRLTLDGVVLVGIGAGSYFAIHRLGQSVFRSAGLQLAPPSGRLLVALFLDGGIVASLVAGISALIRAGTGAGSHHALIDALVTAGVTAAAYVVIALHGPGQTVGEALLAVSYRMHLRHPDRRDATFHGHDPGEQEP